jgi:ribonucleoside-diphosphate reductase alpha chain
MSTVASLSDNAMRVLEARYLLRDASGAIAETPEQMFSRVAGAVAEAETRFDAAADTQGRKREFFDLMSSLSFLPNSPTLMNAGTSLGQLSACFVLPVDDTMEDIFESLKQMALVQRSGGGTGFSFSRLRPQGDFVSTTGGEASGPVSFMRIFDAATENIRQGGKRRGANMGVLRADHPDVLRFIEAKRDGTSLQNFNISIAATDAFMLAVRDGGQYDLVHPGTQQPAGRLFARDVFDAIVDAAWHTGDPGLLFMDAINRANPTPEAGPIEATNPCGEVPLLPWEACNLGSINLATMLRSTDRGNDVDWDRLARTVRSAVRFLDDVIEVNRYPAPQFERMARENRKIGLGVMGFADLLVELDVPYDSPGAVSTAERIMRFIADESLAASRALADERGTFDGWRGSVYEAQGVRVRNATRTAIAPTGTIGIIAGASPSIEPLFALAYHRNVLDGQRLAEVNPMLLRHASAAGLDLQRLLASVSENGGLRGAPDVPDDLRRRFATALEVPWRQHLEVQAAFQRHVDNSVSKTINLPADAARDDVASAFTTAWELGLKGVTIFRYGSKGMQVLEIGAGGPMECRV